jgi:putative ABC transport system ATP-binding protein
MTDDALLASDLEKTFGEGDLAVTAVHDVSMELAHGEVVLLMGPSGSGKTTLLSMLGGMLRPTRGSVVIAGVDLATARERELPKIRAQHFGFVFQDFNLLSALTALENVELACNLAGVKGAAAHTRARELLERFGLGKRLRFHPAKLSGGEQQRVAIARALANDPPLILADEPTANLDSKIGHEVGRLLRELAHEEGRSVLMVSHDTRLQEVADRVLWLEDGTLADMAQMTVDPVCGMSVAIAQGPHYQHGGRTWWFCSSACRDEFAIDPARYERRQINRGYVGTTERSD